MKVDKLDKQRLILISDIWGKKNSEWINFYIDILGQHFEVVFYDSCDLGNIDKSEHLEEKLHQKFINGGVEKAVERILQLEKEQINILGFSIGGYIAWKACLLGLNAKNLFAISSTRLRYEIYKPETNVQLFYGENDSFKPDQNWFKKIGLGENIVLNESHGLYKEKQFAQKICNLILNQIT